MQEPGSRESRPPWGASQGCVKSVRLAAENCELSLAEKRGVMEFRLLGPLEVVSSGDQIAVTAARQQAVLAYMLLEAGRVVSVDRIVDVLWGDRPPKTARSQVQITVSGLRQRLGGRVIVTQFPGYAIKVPPESIDLAYFEKLLDSGARAAAGQCLPEAVRAFRAALALWRGPALEGVQSEALRNMAIRLNESRVSVIQDCLAIELQLGRHREMIGELTELVAEHPLNERFRGQLMLALYYSGRQADALSVFRDGREVLREELGLDPHFELRQLEEAILTRSLEIEPSGPRCAVKSFPLFTGPWSDG